jgi:hypothetical protein
VAFSKDTGGKTMTNQMGQARGKLMRLEQDLGRAKGNLESATHKRIVGGVILLIGMIALIQFNVAIGVVGLLVGGWVFVRALAKIGQVRRSIDTITDRVTNARAKLAELKAQPSVAE